jgi:hypothetical protein
LIGPDVGAAAAAPSAPTVATGWTCHPNGSGVVGTPSTTLSLGIIFGGAPRLDSISCIFPMLTTPVVVPGGASGIQVGGDCYYHEGGGIGIEFAHRLYIVEGTSATLFCWNGTQAPG